MSNKTRTQILPTIPKEVTTEITISGGFHSRLLGAYFNLASKYEEEELLALFKHIHNDTISTMPEDQMQNALSLQTLLILVKGIELSFKQEGKFVDKEFEIPISD